MKIFDFIPYGVKAKLLVNGEFYPKLSDNDIFKNLKIEVSDKKRVGATYMLLATLLQRSLVREESLLFEWDIETSNIISQLNLLEKKVNFYLSLIFKIDEGLLLFVFNYLLDKKCSFDTVVELMEEGGVLIRMWKKEKEKEVVSIKQIKKA